jgi:cell division septation protein DedD
LNQRVFKGLGLGALLLGLLILLLLILYHFLGSRPAPVPTGNLEVKPQTLPGVSEAPGTPPPLAAPIAPPLEQPPAPPGEGVGISGTTPPKTSSGPPAAKEQPMAPLEEERKYGLSVGAFPNFRSAEKMLDKLRKQGTEGFIRRTPGKKKGFEVIAGPFSSKQEAEAAAKSLKTKLHVSPKLETIIIPVSK